VGHVELLPGCHLRRRKWIAPALVVPVIHVLAKYDHSGSRDILLAVERLEQGIRRRAAGASLGGKQLDQHRLF
jgi:hypothetical protein